jgi:hypothetical protein
MSSPAVNPYQPPLVATKLTPAEAADIKHRDIATLILLFVVTLGFYWFYLGYQWAKELNGLSGRVKYQPNVFLIVNLVSCGLAGIVFECLYAFDVAEHAKAHGIKDRLEPLPSWVISINCAAMIASLIPLGVIIGLPLGILASVLVQVEMNKLAERYAPRPG